MKIYISIDMEGIAGVAAGDHVLPGSSDYHRFRRLMTQEANAAIQGAIDGGATEIVVNDSHASMTNLLIEELHSEARLISGSNKPLLQMEGIDSSFDAVFLVGYHQREGGGDGVLNHTFMGKIVYDIRINGQPVDEAITNAGIAGYYGVPVALVTGDSAVCGHAGERLPGVVTAPVKEPLDRYASLSLTPEKAHQLIHDRASRAVQNVRTGQIKPYQTKGPFTFEVDFKRTAPALMATLLPNVERTGPRTIALTDDDYLRAFKLFHACLLIGDKVFDGSLI
ncbi:M55 family metallopeptidase [Paenactinomyces guangxiensis]|uniref:M55 family metallopeptidase n=1 Tax=Paenactinomyces guangxiensis TaxID=1490290 RepID=A0A7W1WMS3_9BACL|nr:M55 family metallopeptidase [Paenactinomyces guangxiensis]MBA4492788.1 M55 family metallopeptidase [Paenactinomyces guangxiensis]MBH8590363.1 M55 family metallopeptidase [Paenactinomyces guangxiensis]